MNIGQVIKIINPNHKYYNEKAVIQFKTDKMYAIRLLNQEKPLYTRFLFSNGKLTGVLSLQITMYIVPTSIKQIKGQYAKPETNTWQNETSKLMSKYSKMSRTQIEEKIKHKLISWKS